MTVSNQAMISYDSDGNGTNDASAVTDDPGAAGAADPTAFPVSGPGLEEVPTLSPLGLLLLTVLLAGLALALLKRRQGAEK